MNANFEYLCYGLMAAWLIVTFYVILLGLRESKLQRELARVRQMVETHTKSSV
jgi:CcmD family protein